MLTADLTHAYKQVQHQQYTIWDSRVQSLQRSYLAYLLKNEKLVLALHLATELQSRSMCQTLVLAAERYTLPSPSPAVLRPCRPQRLRCVVRCLHSTIEGAKFACA